MICSGPVAGVQRRFVCGACGDRRSVFASKTHPPAPQADGPKERDSHQRNLNSKNTKGAKRMNRHVGQYRCGLGLKGVFVVALFLIGISPFVYAHTFNVPAGDVNALIEAINNANNETLYPGPDTINLAAGSTYTLTVVNNNTDGPNGLPSITSTITINGNGAIIERSTSAPGFRIFHVSSQGNLTLNNLTVRQGSTNPGGGIYNQGKLTLNNSTVSNNSGGDGVGIYNTGIATVNNSIVSNNDGQVAIYNGGTGTFTIDNSMISNNNAQGIINVYGILFIFNSVVSSNNYRGRLSGGIENIGTATVRGSNISYNAGRGIFNSSTGTLTVSNSMISRNVMWEGGAGIYNDGITTVENSTISENRSQGGNRHGGGILNSSAGTLTVSNSTISSNYAEYDGGGIYNRGTVTVSNSTLSQNNGNYGGAIYSAGLVILRNSTLSSNQARDRGGGIYNASGGVAWVSSSTLSGNSASGSTTSGGGVYNDGIMRLRNVIIANSAAGGNCRGTITSLGYNLSSDNTCSLTQPTDQTNTDPLLGPLQNNGGPTETHALSSDSPALDRIPPAACIDLLGDPVTTDQRGVITRPQGANCDIGAFEREQFSLMVTKAGTGSGTVTSNPRGINCGLDCEQGYDPDTEVTLTATPNSGSVFTGWSGDTDCSDGQVIMDSNKNCIATFSLRTGTIIIVKDTQPNDPRDFTFTASGGLSPSVFKLDDDSDPTLPNSRTFSNVPEGTYTIIESAASGFELTNLSCNDPDSGSSWDLDNYTVTIDLDMGETVTCTFTNKKLFMLAATKTGLGSGTVTSDPPGINCGSDCSESYPFATSVTLLATPNEGSLFGGWGGDPDCTDGQVVMDAHKACIAIFNLQPLQFTLTVTKAGDGNGTVVSNPVGINCGDDCTETYNEGAIVNLIANADPGSVFTGWSGDPDCSDGQVTMNANKTCTATFNLMTCQGVTATSSPAKVTFRRANQQATIRVTVRNNSGATRTVTAITPQADEPFTIVRISPFVPKTINNRSSRTFTVTVRGPAAGPFPVVATSPYFNTALDCGVLTTAAEPRLLVPLRVEGIHSEFQGDQVLVEARGEGIASVQLRLFDLHGKQLVDQSGDATTLTLPAVDSSGRPLANGVYLYVVRVRGFDGREYVSEVRKLVILR